MAENLSLSWKRTEERKDERVMGAHEETTQRMPEEGEEQRRKGWVTFRSMLHRADTERVKWALINCQQLKRQS